MTFCNLLFKGRYWDKKMWPSCSPDLNPLDYRIWARMLQMMGRRTFRSIAPLKKALKKIWRSFTVAELKPIISEFKTRLEACIEAKGGHFEHKLKRNKKVGRR
jgi:hypothetical protein